MSFATEDQQAFSVGIDIGTTNISGAVVELVSKRQVAVRTLSNSFSLKSASPLFAEQDAEGIVKCATALLDELLSLYPDTVSVGITGQMHGIVYLDAAGNAVSPLATWQDRRGEALTPDGETYCEHLRRQTGKRIAAGYGFATHFYNVCNGLVPKTAVTVCSIMDYLALRLTSRADVLMHSSVAASLGFFDAETHSFEKEGVEALLGGLTLPRVTADFALYGTYRGIPVAVAIGDNQASFLGSVKHPEKSVLLNIGTGSQISFVSGFCEAGSALEVRPLVKDCYLVCGSALCGGYAYSLLERFFRAYAASLGGEEKEQYALMGALAEEAYLAGADYPTVEPTFCGTRSDPAKRGAVTGLAPDNFTPHGLILGMLHGMCDELHGLFSEAKPTGISEIVASGGAVEKNPTLCRVIADTFGMPVFLPSQKEEAATGAALFAAIAAGRLEGLSALSDFIRYRS